MIYSQNPDDYIMILGDPGPSGMIPKKGKFSAIFNQTQMQQFTGSETSTRYTKISLGLLMHSGLEIKIGKYLKKDNLSIDTRGIAYHIKKKTFGIGLHFTSYKHNVNDFYQSKSRETGISIHKRFKKKDLKPFMYYARVLLFPTCELIPSIQLSI